MPATVPNQNVVVIHCDKPKTNFLQIKNENWMEFNKKYGPFALQLYLYLAKNADGFQLALSQQAAEDEAGIAKTTFHKYVKLLIKEGYLVHRSGSTYDFYETPHKQENKDLRSTPCGELDKPPQEQQNLSHERRSSPDFAESPQTNKEIYNIYTDITNNKQIKPNSFHQQGERIKRTEKPDQGFIF